MSGQNVEETSHSQSGNETLTLPPPVNAEKSPSKIFKDNLKDSTKKLDDPSDTASVKSDLIDELGIKSWAHSDTALIEALKLRTEKEKTEQESIRNERYNKVIEILNISSRLGLPGHKICELIESSANGCQQQQQPMQGVQAQPIFGQNGSNMLNSSPKGISNIHSQILNPVFPNSPAGNVFPQPQMMGQPGPIQQYMAKTPLKNVQQSPANSTQLTPLTENLPTLPPFYSTPMGGMQTGSPSSSNWIKSDTSDQFIPAHRSTVSAIPTFNPVEMAANSINQGPQLRDNMQQPYSFPRNFPPNNPALINGGLSTKVSPQHSNSSSRDARIKGIQLPQTINEYHSKSHKSRAHRRAASASELQIHQWNPDQITLDNRWKIGSPKVKESSQNSPSGKAHLKSEHARKSSSQSGNIVAAQNNRRRSAGGTSSAAKRRSASLQTSTPQPVMPVSHGFEGHQGQLQQTSASVPQSSSNLQAQTDNMSVLASVAGEQSKNSIAQTP